MLLVVCEVPPELNCLSLGSLVGALLGRCLVMFLGEVFVCVQVLCVGVEESAFVFFVLTVVGNGVLLKCQAVHMLIVIFALVGEVTYVSD